MEATSRPTEAGEEPKIAADEPCQPRAQRTSVHLLSAHQACPTGLGGVCAEGIPIHHGLHDAASARQPLAPEAVAVLYEVTLGFRPASWHHALLAAEPAALRQLRQRSLVRLAGRNQLEPTEAVLYSLGPQPERKGRSGCKTDFWGWNCGAFSGFQAHAPQRRGRRHGEPGIQLLTFWLRDH